MRIFEAIDQADELKPNDFTQDQKIQWLAALDFRLYTELLLQYADPLPDFTIYTSDTELTKKLLVPPPFDELYPLYLIMRMELFNGEVNRYNNARLVYQSALQSYLDHCTRTSRCLHSTTLRF